MTSIKIILLAALYAIGKEMLRSMNTVDPGFTVGNPDSNPTVNEVLVNARTLERFFNQKIDRETGNIVDTVKDRIKNAILTAIGILLLLKSNSLLGL